jgi:uncharacterized membrane protein (UPF0127 family)
MPVSTISRRLARLPTVVVGGVEVPVAEGPWPRLLGLSHLDRDEAGAGLLIPRCSSIHTFGMRFALDVRFLDSRGTVLREAPAVGPRRIVSHRAAIAVLETPAAGESRGRCAP